MIEVIQNPAEFAALKDEWTELLSAGSSPCLFLTWEWLHTWWKHLSGGKRLRIAAVRRDGRLAALAPLAVTRGSWNGLSPFSRAEFLGAGFVGSDYLDVIARPEFKREALRELAGWLAAEKIVLELGQLRQGACLAEDLALEMAARGWTVTGSPANVCPYIDLAGQTWESYLASLGSEHRYNFHRRRKNLGKQFQMRWEQACSEESRRRALAVLFELHNKRWEGRESGSDAFHLPGLVSFHEEFSRVALERGWLRLSVLWLNDKPAAALYGFRFGDVYYFYQSGFDPEYRKYSVGLVTMGLGIQGAIQEGATEYDLLHGEEPYKAHWARQVRPLGRLRFYPPAARGLLYQAAALLDRASRRMARQLLPKSMAEGISARIRGQGKTAHVS
jgi:CelD/BcsL family acetyltransferase involved in cellulose biosynthesis